MARSVNRLDWWNVWAELTPYEWACQQAMSVVEPFGETRADIRSALNTAATVANTGMATIPEEQIQKLFEKLVTYLDGKEEKVVSPDEAARMVG